MPKGLDLPDAGPVFQASQASEAKYPWLDESRNKAGASACSESMEPNQKIRRPPNLEMRNCFGKSAMSFEDSPSLALNPRSALRKAKIRFWSSVEPPGPRSMSFHKRPARQGGSGLTKVTNRPTSMPRSSIWRPTLLVHLRERGLRPDMALNTNYLHAKASLPMLVDACAAPKIYLVKNLPLEDSYSLSMRHKYLKFQQATVIRRVGSTCQSQGMRRIFDSPQQREAHSAMHPASK